jgi:hypothetical protein
MSKPKPKPCSALAEVIRPRSPFEAFDPPYPIAEIDLSPLLVSLMIRLNDDADDDGVVADFCESFGLKSRPLWPPLRLIGTQARRCIDAQAICLGIKSA